MDAFEEKAQSIGRTLQGWAVKIGGGVIDWIEKHAAMLGAISAGGTPEDAIQSLKSPEVTKNNAAKIEKEATDKINAEKKVAAYEKKLADEDAAWTKGIIEAEEKDRRALMKDRFAQDIKDAEEAENLKMDNKKKSIDLDKEALEEEKKGILDAAELQKQKDDDRRDRLENILQKQGRIANKLLTDTDSNESWQGALARDRKAKSDAERGGRQVAQAQARIDKGVGTARDFALIGGMDAQREAKAARDELIKMDKDAKKAARETADNTAKIEKNIDALAKQINNIARG
jgi:hypothetical protein